MIAIPSIPITITSSNVSIDYTTLTEYVTGTTYAIGDRVKVTELAPADATSYIGYVFESVADANADNPTDNTLRQWIKIGVLPFDETRVYPANAEVVLNKKIHLSKEIDNDTHPLATDTKWVYLQESNETACIDYYFTTTTKKINGNLVMELESDTADTLNIFGIHGSVLTVEQLDSNGNVIQTNMIPHSDPVSITEYSTYLLFNSVGGVTVSGVDVGTQVFNLIDTSSIVDYASYLQFKACIAKNSVSSKLIKSDKQRIRITLEPLAFNGIDIAEIATITIGTEKEIGCTVVGANVKRVALTPPKRDKWGDVTFSGDDFIKVYSVEVDVSGDGVVDKTDAILEELFNAPCMYSITDGTHKSFDTFGIMQDSEVSLISSTTLNLPIKIDSFKYKKQRICNGS